MPTLPLFGYWLSPGSRTGTDHFDRSMNMAHWLAKTEPEECSIDDFANHPNKPVVWEGVRNYQARNFMRQMREGDKVFIYHSSCKLIGIAGIARVSRTAYPDPAQFNQKSPYFDAKSPRDNPRWDAVE